MTSRTRTRSLFLWGLAALALAAMPANRGPVQASTREVVTVFGPRVSVVDDGRTVVTFEAKGDIRGLLTLTLYPASSPLTGELALVSRYAQDLSIGPQDEVPAGLNEETEQPERLAFVERGSIHGIVTGGTLRYDASGQLDAIEALQVRIAGGSQEFKNAQGSASVNASNMQDVTEGNGTVVLAMGVK